MSERVDYVIVGAGTAGCVLASRLSECPGVSVALLEAGGTDRNPAIWETDLDSQRSLWATGAQENWGYETVPQRGLQGRAVPIARGKVLGGCSAINAMIYIRGNRRDFDGWSQLGNRGWAYADVLPYFKRSERYHGPASSYHGGDGPVSVIDYPNASVASHAFVDAAAELGHTRKYNDFNAESQEGGAGLCQSTRTPRRVRVSAASAFITPHAGRQNLRVVTDARVTRLLLERGRAVGVRYAARGALATIYAEREVVLCCGAFETPKLLMLSGLGPHQELTRHGIRVERDISGLGKNLQDHLLLGVPFESQVPLPAPELLAEASLFTWAGGASPLLSPNLQYFFVPFQFTGVSQRASGPGFTFIPILAQPRSRGAVTLASSDPAALACVDTQYLSADEDIAVLEYGIRYARELAHTKSFAGIRGRELLPGSGAMSSLELRTFIRREAMTVWHPAGTCRMGTDRDAVVDSELKVHGVDGLRIADASIMPALVSGNPNAAVMMIAEKAADLILQRRPGGQPSAVDGQRANAVGSASAAPSAPPAACTPLRLAFYRDRLAPVLRGALAEPGFRELGYGDVSQLPSRATSGVAAAMCLATCAALGGSERQALPSAAALELLHESSILRDAPPGEPSPRGPWPMRLEQKLAASRVADTLALVAARLSKQNAGLLEPALAARVLHELEHVGEESMAGRALELGGPSERVPGAAEERYLLIVLKTVGWGRFIGPARIGALIANPTLTDLEPFNRFGYFLALSHQIRAELSQLVDGPDPASSARIWPPGHRPTSMLAHLAGDAPRARGGIPYAHDAARRFADAAAVELETAFAGTPSSPDLEFLRSMVELGPYAEDTA